MTWTWLVACRDPEAPTADRDEGSPTDLAITADTGAPPPEPTGHTGGSSVLATADTAVPFEHPYASCVSVSVDSVGITIEDHFDAGGRLVEESIDFNVDGTPDGTWTYTYVLAGDVVVETHWTTTHGEVGARLHDEHGHVVSEESRWRRNPVVTAAWTNTHAGALLASSTETWSDTGRVTTTTYDACERPVRGDHRWPSGATEFDETRWTYARRCVPERQEFLINGAPAYRVEYDAQGRERQSVYVQGLSTRTWTWTCPP